MQSSLNYKSKQYALRTDRNGKCVVTVWAGISAGVSIYGQFDSGHSVAVNAEADSFALSLAESDAVRLAETIIQAVNATGSGRIRQLTIDEGAA